MTTEVGQRGNVTGGIIQVGIAVVVGFIVINSLVNGTSLSGNSLVNLTLTVFIPVGLLIGVGRVLGFI